MRGRLLRDAGLVARKELQHLRRDRRAQLLTLALPVAAMAAFAMSFGGQGFEPTGDATPYPLAVQDQDRTLQSRQFVEVLHATRLFELHQLPADANVSRYVASSGAFAGIVLPQGFGEDVASGRPRIDFVYDNARPYVGALTVSRVKLVLEAIALQQGRGADIRYQALVETGSPLDMFTPGIVVLLLAFTSLHDVATSLARERGEGTLGRVFLAPTEKAAFLLGKVGASLVLVLARALLLLGLAIVALRFRMQGDIASFLLLAALVGIVTMAMGILLAARARTDREVMVGTLLVTILLMFLMGAITPLDLMTPPARAFASILPHTHATGALRRVMLLDSSALTEWRAVLLLAASGAGLLAVGVRVFRRSLD